MSPVVLHWDGEIDLGVAPRLQAEVVAAIDRATDSVVLDLSRVTFLDCAGISVLVVARVHADDRGRALVLRQVPAGVAIVLRLTGVDTLFR